MTGMHVEIGAYRELARAGDSAGYLVPMHWQRDQDYQRYDVYRNGKYETVALPEVLAGETYEPTRTRRASNTKTNPKVRVRRGGVVQVVEYTSVRPGEMFELLL